MEITLYGTALTVLVKRVLGTYQKPMSAKEVASRVVEQIEVKEFGTIEMGNLERRIYLRLKQMAEDPREPVTREMTKNESNISSYKFTTNELR